MPTVRGLEREYGDRVAFVWANVLDETNVDLMYQFSFSTTPEIYLVDEQGEIIGFWDEMDEADPLREALDGALSGQP